MTSAGFEDNNKLTLEHLQTRFDAFKWRVEEQVQFLC